MSDSTLPVEGWVDACASYGLAIVRLVVSGIRDDGPLGAFKVHRLVKRAGVGGDVKKASPNFNEDDGAARITNFLVADLDVVRVSDGTYAVDTEVRQAYSKHFQRFFSIPSRDEAEVARDAFNRVTHLRRWLMGNSPFAPGGEWANGIRKHSDEDIIALANLINAIGYAGEPIVKDQRGVTISGHAREAALTKLGIDPAEHTVVKHFRDDRHRLAYVVAENYVDGKLPVALRDGIKRYVNKTMRGSGVKVNWSGDGFGDFFTIVGDGAYTPELVTTAPVVPVVPVAAEPVVEPMVRPAEPKVEPEPDERPHVDHRITNRKSAIFKAAQYWYDHGPASTIEIQDRTGIQIHRIGSISKWKKRGWLVSTGDTYPGKRKGQPAEVLALTDDGRRLVEEMNRPYRPSFRDANGSYVYRPGGVNEDTTSLRSRAIEMMTNGRWMTRQALSRYGGVHNALRRQMWFVYEGTAYIVVPNVFTEDWERVRILPLTTTERLGLIDAARAGDEALWGLWETLVSIKNG